MAEPVLALVLVLDLEQRLRPERHVASVEPSAFAAAEHFEASLACQPEVVIQHSQLAIDPAAAAVVVPTSAAVAAVDTVPSSLVQLVGSAGTARRYEVVSAFLGQH